jgi:hypothetical protein
MMFANLLHLFVLLTTIISGSLCDAMAYLFQPATASGSCSGQLKHDFTLADLDHLAHALFLTI